MRAGNLREVIKVFDLQKTTNDLGEVVKSNVLLKTIRAEVRYDSGKESENNGQLTAIQAVTFIIRYDPAITETMLIEYKGSLYNIRYIEPTLHVKTTLTCTKNK